MNYFRPSFVTAFIIALLTMATACTNNPEERRTPGDLIDDNALEFVIAKEIRASDEGYEGAHLVVTVYDGLVLLLGEVASTRLQERRQRLPNRFTKSTRTKSTATSPCKAQSPALLAPTIDICQQRSKVACWSPLACRLARSRWSLKTASST